MQALFGQHSIWLTSTGEIFKTSIILLVSQLYWYLHCWGRARKDFSTKVISWSFCYGRRKLDNGQDQQFEGWRRENWAFSLPMILSLHFPGPQVTEGSENSSAWEQEEIDPPGESAQMQGTHELRLSWFWALNVACNVYPAPLFTGYVALGMSLSIWLIFLICKKGSWQWPTFRALHRLSGMIYAMREHSHPSAMLVIITKTGVMYHFSHATNNMKCLVYAGYSVRDQDTGVTDLSQQSWIAHSKRYAGSI